MNRLPIATLALALALAGCAGKKAETRAQPAVAAPQPAAPAALPYLSQLPPLVEREVFFDDPEIATGRISPDGKLISFRKPHKGVMNLWVKELAQPFTAAWPITADDQRPISQYFWSRDGKHVLYVQDKGGDENFHLYAVDPRAKPDETLGVPRSRDLTPLPNVRVGVIALPKKDPTRALIALNDRDPQLHDVYRLDLKSGERKLVLQNDANVASWLADLSGQVRLAVRMTADGGTELLPVAGNKLGARPVYTCTADESCYPIRFHKDGKRLYLSTNKGERDLQELVLLDVKTGKETLVDRDPERKVDFGFAQFSEATDELIATAYTDARVRIYAKHPAFEKDLRAIRAAIPDGDLSFADSTRDDKLWILQVTSDVDPGATYLYRRDTQKAELLFRPYPNLPIASLAPMQPVAYPARDGFTIPAYLTVPKNVEAKNLAAVLLVHGGPWARDVWGYNPYAQLLANRGYAVLQPNFRGSSGYGKKFLNAGNKQWGTGAMQHDLTDGVKWLVEQGIANPKQVAIMGGSYGGYATLAGLAFTPDVYAAGVDIVGPSNIITLLNSIPPYWAPMKKMFAIRVGDMDKPEELELLKAQSPLHSAKQIQAPLLVIQGANDPRVKQHESDQIVAALRDLNLPVEYLVATDEGHGYRGRDNRVAMTVAIERFLHQHLRGRVQESVSPEIKAKLAKLTVDPKAVVVNPPATGAPGALSR